jgi:hypothetical protein
MLSLGAKVPLYFWRKQTPAIEQAALEAESAREQTQATQLHRSHDPHRQGPLRVQQS